jgi:hypothetical protein
MEQRRLRLGDILDDYCPRERRVTNHAVVAMIEEDIKQTRCTTCEAEHAYKGARVPKRRKKETPGALYQEVLAGMPETDHVPVLAAAIPVVAVPLAPPDEILPEGPPVDVISSADPIPVNRQEEDVHPPMHTDDNDQRDELPEPETRVDEDAAPAVDGPVHRPLIRATLPRPEGQKDARPVPEFTVRHAPPRGNGHGSGSFRGERMRMRAGGGHANDPREPNGNRAPTGGARFQSNRPSGSGRKPMGRSGSPSGFRSGSGGPNGKRGRGPRG